MYPKVSMVIPCYNKEHLISQMLDSILAQKWNNIELIFVNDGSTDGTRDIILEYKSRFIKRGFEVVIIDQKNQGVATAVYNGLKIITGEYVCQVDADDELDDKYVSQLAGFLVNNLEYDWVCCDYIKVLETQTKHIQPFPNNNVSDCTLEKWIMRYISPYVWLYMIRSEYLKKCRVVKLFYMDREGDQEIQYLAPLICGGGRLKYLPVPLYKYTNSDNETNLSYASNYEEAKSLYFGRGVVYKNTISRLPISNEEKQRLYAIVEIGIRYMLVWRMNSKCHESITAAESINALMETATLYFNSFELIKQRHAYKHPYHFRVALRECLLRIPRNPLKDLTDRVIAWGVMGQRGISVLPLLEDSVLEPDELWDISGDGINIKKPDIQNLTENDIVLVLPLNSADILEALKASKCKKTLCYQEIQEIIKKTAKELYFPAFYDGRVTFNV